MRFFLKMTLVLICFNVSAHNPQTASVLFSPINNIWVAQYTISQEGATIALTDYYKDTKLNELTTEEFKTLYIAYIKEKFELLIDGNTIPLESGGIKLGNHQTNIKFLLPQFPENFKLVNLSLPLFEELSEQNTVVRFNDETKSIRKVLNKKNKFQFCFENSHTEMKEISNTQLRVKTITILISILLFLLIAFFTLKIKWYNNIK